METLGAGDLVRLVRTAFPRKDGDRRLALLVDVPRQTTHDNPDWTARREMAASWASSLRRAASEIPLDGVDFVAYPATLSNNADLPPNVFLFDGPLPNLAEELPRSGRSSSFEEVFRSCQILLAPTEFSTTAPLKKSAPVFGFRAATMPGFSPAMIPALRLDYDEIDRRVRLVKERLDRAVGADVRFVVDGERTLRMHFDLRHRTAHASSGRFPDSGTAGNLPSGEAYIVPFEGTGGDPSETVGHLPVQHGDEVVVYRVVGNRAVAVEGEGEAAALERDWLAVEPAYGNIAELGFGVLHELGVEPVGSLLLDEKLGFHVAFGRSDHFGGQVGPSDFRDPENVVHLDHIYIPPAMPRVGLAAVELDYGGGATELLLEFGEYRIFGSAGH